MSVVFDFNDPRLQTLPDALRKICVEVVIECIDDAVGYAKAYVPTDTHALQLSIRREGLSFVAGDGGIFNPRTGREVDYAAIVEARYPYFKAGWAAASQGIEEKIKQRVMEAFK